MAYNKNEKENSHVVIFPSSCTLEGLGLKESGLRTKMLITQSP